MRPFNYEEDFLNYQSHQVPGVFTDPLFLPNMVNSVYKLVIPPVLSGAPPFAAAQDCPTIPLESGDDRDSAAPPSPSPSTVCAPTAEKSKAGLPTTPSKSLVNLIQSQIELRIWNLR